MLKKFYKQRKHRDFTFYVIELYKNRYIEAVWYLKENQISLMHFSYFEELELLRRGYYKELEPKNVPEKLLEYINDPLFEIEWKRHKERFL